MGKKWLPLGIVFLLLGVAPRGWAGDEAARCLAPLFSSRTPVPSAPADFDRLAKTQREYLRILKVDPESLWSYRLTAAEAEAFRRPLPPWISPYPKPLRMDPREIRFMQIVATDAMQDGTHSVLENAAEIRAGRTKADDLPMIRVWMDERGQVWTLDHRRLASVRLAGNVDSIKVKWVDEASVRASAFKFTTRNEGKSVYVRLTSNLVLEVK
ncbi:MAG: hypothetical protein JST16_10485 [Bdellovibrionales bacterium]|nr:hypothetical protein [Bdellovibrionales bacterium]